MSFVHLHVHSNFSFLDAGSSVQALLDRAKALGYDALALTDHNGLYGAVRFYKYAKRIGIKPIIGAEMEMDDGSHIVLLAKDIKGYSNLCKIITRAKLGAQPGEPFPDADASELKVQCRTTIEVLDAHREGLICLSGCWNGEIAAALLRDRPQAAKMAADKYYQVFGNNLYIELQNHLLPGTAVLNQRLSNLADEMGLRTVATNNVHYAEKGDFKLQDVLVCVQTLTTLDEPHDLRKRNAEYYMKSPQSMARLFREYPKALAATGLIASQCDLDLGLGTYRFPDFPVPDGETPYSYLCKLCFEGLKERYQPITPKVIARLQHELDIINDLGFAEYFLVVWDIVRFANSKGIRCSGRGSAADSIVAYCLDVTKVDPIEHDLLFERFLNPERKGMPDVDIDFDALRRDEVIEYIYRRYGEDRVAMVCTVNTLCARSSIRDIGKAMDFPPEDIDRLARSLPHTRASRIREAMQRLPELRDSDIPIERLEALVETCEKTDGFPRHLGVHLGGVVVGKGVLTDLVPLEWATKGVVVTQFDKDDIEDLGLVKMDILGLRNLSAIEEALALIRRTRGIELDIDHLPLDDPAVYELLRSTKTVGLFQLESAGMRGLLGRLQPTKFDDIIANISLFRPGPMQADMINPFIARRHGKEPVSYIHPDMEPALKETYGVIIYQEQVLRVAAAVAGFTMGQADSFRRAMTTDRSQEEMEKIRATFVESATKRGVDRAIAEEVFGRLRAFAAYGFCKAHAAAFGKIAYQTAYLKAHYPAEFLAGILSCEPMGFYPPNVIVEEARHLGIEILGPDINKSEKKFTVENPDRNLDHQLSTINYQLAIRVGFMQIRSISSTEIESILIARAERPFESFSDFCRRANVSRPVLENLINVGAFDPFGYPRGKLLWMVGETSDSPTPNIQHSTLNLGSDDFDDQIAGLPDIPELTPHERVRLDYDIMGLSPLCHPMVFYREKLAKAGIRRTSELAGLPNNTIVKVAGVVVVCMRPPTKSGAIVVFITLEDEDGLADCVVFPQVYTQYGGLIFNNPALIIEGKVQKMGKRAVSIIARKIAPLAEKYCTDDAEPLKPFKERIRIAGARSFVRSVGV